MSLIKKLILSGFILFFERPFFIGITRMQVPGVNVILKCYVFLFVLWGRASCLVEFDEEDYRKGGFICGCK